MLEDRMEPENLKELATSIMGQQEAGGPARASGPDRRFAEKLFKGAARIRTESVELQQHSLDLSALMRGRSPAAVREDKAPGSGKPVALVEDLVQQAAQCLVQDRNDAFLAITQRLSPDEVMQSLQVARQWRRADDNWQEDFRDAPETGFKFIDRKTPDGKSGSGRPNMAEEFVREIIEKIRNEDIPIESTPLVIQQESARQKLGLNPKQVNQLTQRVILVIES